MTRINISYLLALGLLGSAVACKYRIYFLSHRAAAATNSSTRTHTDSHSQHPHRCPKANKK
jgi:hypothetical protein